MSLGANMGGGVMSRDNSDNDEKRERRERRNEFARAYALLPQIAIGIIVCLGVGIFLGVFLDRLFGTSPWLLLVFTLLGIVAAFKSIFDFAKRL